MKLRRSHEEYKRLHDAMNWLKKSFRRIHEMSPPEKMYDVIYVRMINGQRHTDIVARSIIPSAEEKKEWSAAGYRLVELFYPSIERSQHISMLRAYKTVALKQTIYGLCMELPNLPEMVIEAYMLILGGIFVNTQNVINFDEEMSLQKALFNNLETPQDVVNYTKWLHENYKDSDEYQDSINFEMKYVMDERNLHGYPPSERAYRDAIKFKEQVDTHAK